MNKETTEKKVKGMSAGAGLLLVVVAAITLELTGLIQYYYSQRGIKEEASLRAQSELRSAENEIMGIVDGRACWCAMARSVRTSSAGFALICRI